MTQHNMDETRTIQRIDRDQQVAPRRSAGLAEPTEGHGKRFSRNSMAKMLATGAARAGVLGLVLVVLAAVAHFSPQRLQAEPKTVAQPLRTLAVCPTWPDAETLIHAEGGEGSTSINGASVSMPASVKIAKRVTKPVVLSGLGDVQGVSVASAAQSAWMSTCQTPGTEFALPIVDASRGRVVLYNPDPNPAAVDLQLLGAQGPIQAPGTRGVIVPAMSTRELALNPIVPNGALVVAGSTSQGRIVAVANHPAEVGGVAASATAPMATEVVIPGPQPKGTHTLIVGNPSDAETTAQVVVYGTSAPFTPVGTDEIDIPAKASVSIDVTTPLTDQPGALQITALDPVSAALATQTPQGTVIRTGSMPERSLEGFVWPAAKGSLQLANPSEKDITTTVSVAGKAKDVLVPAKSSVDTPVGAGLVTVEASEPVYGAMLVGATGLSWMPLTPKRATPEPLQINLDARTGR